jgi:uncharacterized membrane protein
MRIASVGHAVFAATLIALGILGLINGNLAAIWLPLPRGVPARQGLVCLCAIVSLVSGIGLLWRRSAAVSSLLLFCYLLAWLLLVRVPHLFLDPGLPLTWAAGQVAVMVAAAWVLYVWNTADRNRPWPGLVHGNNGLRIARSLYGLALIPFGVAHFTYLERTVSLVPRWLPTPTAWAYVTGFTFIAAGVAVLIGAWARLTVTLSVLQLGLFTLIVWVPIVLVRPSASDWAEFVVSWVLTSAAWVVADSCRGMPWFAVDRRGLIRA